MTTPIVLGANGQLGSELARLAGPDSGITREQVSISDASAVEALIAARRPALVFNCAAYNAVDRSESEPHLAFELNSQGPLNVALACTRHDARLVHFSTNFVFDGNQDRPYLESDPSSPQGAYATSKLEGETRLLDAMPGALVIRTAALYGGHRGTSFPERILERARRGERIKVVADQRVNPTYAKDLAAVAFELGSRGWGGLLHVVGGGCCGWDELARAVLAEFGLRVEVEGVSSAAYDSPARRPLNGCLASTRVEPMRPWREALHEWAAAHAARTG